MDPKQRIKLALATVVFFLVIGTFGYTIIDDFPFLEAFYMTVITISTVGYGEVLPLSEGGKIFSIFLILSGVGSLAFAAGAFTELLIERSANPDKWKKTMEKRISELKKHVIICGHGRVGAAAAEHFRKNNTEFVIIENSEEAIRHISEMGYHYIKGDGTREETLQKAGVKQASALLAVLNSDPDNLFAVLTARELNPVLKIIARTELSSSESRMLRAGADSIISPFVAAGQKVAKNILNKKPDATGEFTEEMSGLQQPEWLSTETTSSYIGQKIEDAARVFGGVVVGIRRGTEDQLLPDGSERIAPGDTLLVSYHPGVVSGNKKSITHKKVVFVDDNPVILRLYTRLFQKAGVDFIGASTGEEGYGLIVKEAPDAAVIDYHLPDISGLEICRKIRAKKQCDTMKLYLFTGDEQEETRHKAKEIGIDEIVVKSPDAGEIVSLVLKNIR